MAKDVMISSVGPGGKRTPVSIHRMNGKSKVIWKKGRKSRGKTKVQVYKVQTLGGPIWRTAISEGGMTTTYDTRGSGKQTRRLEIKAGSLYSPGLKALAEKRGYVGEYAIPDAFYYDITRASRISGQYRDDPPTSIKQSSKGFYDQAAAKAFAKSEYEKGLALYEGGLAWLGAKARPRFARLAAPTMRGAARAGRGAARAMGLGGGRGGSQRAQRATQQTQRSWKAWKAVQRKELQRYKRESLDPYRDYLGGLQ